MTVRTLFVRSGLGMALALLVAAAMAAPTLAVAAEPGSRTAVVEATYRFVGSGSTATCFVLALPAKEDGAPPPLLLVTAAHVISQMKGEQAEIQARRRDQASGRAVLEPISVTIRQGEKPLWVQHPKQDVAVLPFTLPAGRTIESLPLSCLADAETWKRLKAEPGDFVRVVGFPHANIFKPSPAGFPLTRLGCLAGYPLPPASDEPRFIVGYNSFEGDSGGPVLGEIQGDDRRETVILGLVHGQHFVDERYDLVYVEGLVRQRLGLGIVESSLIIHDTIGLLHQK